MGFLNPALLVLAAAVAIPLLLHFLHRSEGRRMSFPALRYLLRTEKDHARRIRTRQLLLLLLRCTAIVLTAFAAAQMVLRGPGPAHPPTAVAVILDNSMSSSRVIGEGRVLDTLKAVALSALDQAGPNDRFWILRAGEPWDIAPPLSATEARVRVFETQASGAYGDLGRALERARDLLEASTLPAAEIQLLSDLQVSALPEEAPALNDLPVVVYQGIPEPGPNRFVRTAVVGGGLPPRANRRTAIAATLGGAVGDSTPIPVRVVLGDQLRGAAAAPAGGTAVLPLGPFQQGRVEGYVETDPDELRADDRLWLTLNVEPPPAVAVVGEPGPFVREALAVLEEGGRIRRTTLAEAQRVVAVWGEGIERLQEGQRALVLPGADPALRTALVRRFQEAGVPLDIETGPGGTAVVATNRTGVDLEGVEVRRTRRLVPQGGEILREWAVLDDGSPWLLEVPGREGPILVLASRLDPAETSLPLDAAMVPLLEWALAGSGAAIGPGRREAGTPLSLPTVATHIETPDGTRLEVDGTHEFRSTRQTGLYTVLSGDVALDRFPVNSPLRESLLTPATRRELSAVLASADPVMAGDSDAWTDRVFTRRRGREIWPYLLGTALLLLLLESWVASSGGAERRRSPSPSAPVPPRS
mgnify:CR=1 FL=1